MKIDNVKDNTSPWEEITPLIQKAGSFQRVGGGQALRTKS